MENQLVPQSQTSCHPLFSNEDFLRDHILPLLGRDRLAWNALRATNKTLHKIIETFVENKALLLPWPDIRIEPTEEEERVDNRLVERVRHCMRGVRNQNLHLAAHPGGTTVAVARRHSNVLVWKNDFSKRMDQSLDWNWVSSLAFSPDGTWLGAGCDNGRLLLTNHYAFGEETAEEESVDLSFHTVYDGEDEEEEQGCGIESIAFSKDSDLVVSGHEDSTVRLWCISSQQLLHILDLQDIFVEVEVVCQDPCCEAPGRFVLTDLFSLAVFEVRNGKLENTRLEHRAMVPVGEMRTRASFSANSFAFVCPRSRHGDSDLVLNPFPYEEDYSLGDAAVEPTNKTRLNGHTEKVDLLAFSPNGERLASADWKGEILVWNVKDGSLQKRFVTGGSNSSSGLCLCVFAWVNNHTVVAVDEKGVVYTFFC